MGDKDIVEEARRVLSEASRIHTLKDNDPSKDEDVSWLIEGLADEVERLRRDVKGAEAERDAAIAQYERQWS